MADASTPMRLIWVFSQSQGQKSVGLSKVLGALG
ncbi:hypothetical protein LINPERPRIM_LOCUS433 [Linum perenne]